MSTSSIASPASAHANLGRWFASLPLRVLVMVATFTAAAAYQALHLFALTDNDIWWRLRTGLWMLENHAVLHNGLFSQSASLPWIDSSWGFDLLTAAAYRLFGLAGLPVLLTLFQVAIAIAIFILACGFWENFWPAVILAAVAQCCIAPVHPRPAVCSIVLLAVELALLLRARRTGNVRPLYWLPLIFVVWVNLDRQFSYGLLALALFCIALMIEQLCRRSGVAWFETGLRGIRISALAAIAGGSLLATLVSPYGYRLDALVWQSATSSAADRYFSELHAMRFRQPQDYLLMLLAMTAFFALGRRRSRDLFLISLLIVSAAISFRFQRDNWLVAVVSVGIIGHALVYNQAPATGPQTWRVAKPVTAALVLLVLVAVALRLPARDTLMSKVSESFPVRASDYIRQNHLPQPLFNAYPWGGFLTWYLPEYPVFIDGRVDLYGDDINIAYFKLMDAEIPVESHPGFARAQTILLEANSPLGEALSTLPGFRVAYKDDQAVVLVRTN
ncbi:MAG: hypothetical protein ABSD98_18370 [Candidatus Korobacteraceae bacterium]|jgi:hypothetical protein